MEKVSAVIIEDEFPVAEDIRQLLQSHDFDVTGVFASAEGALPFITNHAPDIALVDVRLTGKISGIDLMRQLSNQFPFIYITANSDPDTYEKAKLTGPHAFLIKPFSPANLIASVNLALHNFSITSNGMLLDLAPDPVPDALLSSVVVNRNVFLRANGKYIKVALDDILYVEADGSYVHIQTSKQRHIVARNLSAFFRKADLPSIVRTHRSYAVNIEKVESFDECYCYLQGHKVPISDQYKPVFVKSLKII